MEQQVETLPTIEVQPQELQEAGGLQALAEFNSLMAQHGEENVESPRLPGVPLPLGALMNACPEPVTAQNAHKFLNEAMALLQAAQAKKKTELEENPTPEDQTEQEEKPAAEETAPVETKGSKESDPIEANEPKEDVQYQTEQSQQKDGSSASKAAKITTKVEATTEQGLDSQNSVPSVTKFETQADRTDETAQQIQKSGGGGIVHPNTSQGVQNVKNIAPLKKQEGATDKKQVEPVTPNVKPKRETIIYTQSAAASDILPIEINKTSFAKEIEENIQDEIDVAHIESKRTIEMNDETVDIQIPDAHSGIASLEKNEENESEERIVLLEDEVIPKKIEIESYIDESTEKFNSKSSQGLTETVDIIEEAEIVKVAATEETIKKEQGVLIELDVDETEVKHELPVPAEHQVEVVAQNLSDRIKRFELERSNEDIKAIYQTLNKITHEVTKIRTEVNSEQDEKEAPELTLEAEEHLKILFVKLFEQLEMDYTPDLLDSFIKLAINPEEPDLESDSSDKQEPIVSQGQGTHELINHILKTAAAIKRQALQAYNIGKSALQLYSQKLITVKAL